MNIFREFLLLTETQILVERFLLELGFNPDSFLNKAQSVATLARRGATDGEKSASRLAMDRMISRAEDEAKTMSDKDAAKRFLDRIKEIAVSMDAAEPEPEPYKPSYRPPPRPQIYPVGTWIASTASKLVGKIKSHIQRDGEVVGYVLMTANSIERITASGFRRATQEEIDATLATRKSTASGQDKGPEAKPKPDKDDKTKQSSGSGVWKVLKLCGAGSNAFGVATKNGVHYIFAGPKSGPFQTKDFTQPPTSYPEKKAIARCYALFKHRLEDKGFIEIYDATITAHIERLLNSSSSNQSDQSSSSSSIDEWKILKLAWNQLNGSDKIYGVAANGITFITFWGRRKGPYSVKNFNSSKSSALSVFNSKVSDGGYVETISLIPLADALMILKQAKDLPK